VIVAVAALWHFVGVVMVVVVKVADVTDVTAPS
jgi:hypothetical protein